MKYSSVTDAHKQGVAGWWRAFVLHQSAIVKYLSGDRGEGFNLSQWVQSHLQAIDPNLMWEFGPGIKKEHRLVITPEAHRELRPLVRYILEQAPAVDNFEFFAYRLPETWDQARFLWSQRKGAGEIEAWECAVSRGDFNSVDIVYYSPDAGKRSPHLDVNMFLLTERLLGEETLEKWIGFIDVKPARSGWLSLLKKTHLRLPVSRLKSAVEEQIEAVRDSLPRRPYCECEPYKGWVVMELKPGRKEDYPGKDDLFVAPFFSRDLFAALYRGRDSFASERFSRHQEIFIYLKIDGSAADGGQMVFPDRASMEEALNAALQGNGCVIGAGTGYRYSYIDMAVQDWDKAVEDIQRVLQRGKITKRSWLLFHEPDYRAEWVGIWPDSPVPLLK